ncbi:hypothetical protein ACLMAL_34450 [Nocardia sp. CWNU-33]|uniref:hypothetical protein n=1 Tax=Nocardia sp. CWNU-33 TaxID=3392117 RepID=UPI00398E8C4C
MEEIGLAEIIDALRPAVADLVEPGSPAAAHVPARWQAIARATWPQDRRELALALWNLDFLNVLPRFVAVLDEFLVDVRVALLRGDWVLLYILRGEYQPPVIRIGWDPSTFGADEPPFFDCLPEPLRAFLRTVHAGFTAPEGESFGPLRPRDMITYAELGVGHAVVHNWDADVEISPNRVMLIADAISGIRYCVSPDLPAGTIGFELGGNIDSPQPFDSTFDTFMSKGFVLSRDKLPQSAETTAHDGLLPILEPVARAVVWNRSLDESTAREQIRDYLADLLDALPGAPSLHPQHGMDGELILPFDDDAGNVYQVDRLDVRYWLAGLPADATAAYLDMVIADWRKRGWNVHTTDGESGIVGHARTPDWYEFTVSDQGVGALCITAASPGFHRPPWA